MKIKYFLQFTLSCLLFTSCASFSDDPYLLNETSTQSKKIVAEIYKVKIGMSRSETEALLKDSLLIGYKVDTDSLKLDPISVPQPYREEAITKNGTTYQVLFYYTAIIRADGLVAEDELTPLIFENDSLVGKGLADLDRIKRM